MESNGLNILNPTKPLISAIAIVKSTQQYIVESTIKCYQQQTWQNKELIVINCAKNDWDASALDLQISDKSIRIIDADDLSAGMARNYGISAANGSVIAQFDCNYWHSPNRLEYQLSSMFKYEAHICVLSRIMEYGNGYARYLSNTKNCILNSIMFIRSNVSYKNIDKSEELQHMMEMINAGSKPVSLDKPELMCKIHNFNNRVEVKSINSSMPLEHLETLNDIIKNIDLD